MIKDKKGKDKVKDTVRETMRGLGGVGFQNDEEFDINSMDIGMPGPRKSPGEVVRDKLIGSYLPLDGWYIKLSKDAGGNEWQFKDKITSYNHWTDLQFEVNDFVRQKTKLEVERTGKAINYGSGRYMIMFFNVNGTRENSEPIIFPVDAQEYFLDAPKNISGVQAGTDVNEILRTIQSTQQQPGDTTKLISDSLRAGLELAGKREDSAASGTNQMMTMFMAMMQAMSQSNAQIFAALAGKPAPTTPTDPMELMRNMLSMQKDLGMLPDKNAAPRSDLEMLEKFKSLGLIKTNGDDTVESFAKMKNLIGMIKDFSGYSDSRPSLIERAIDAVGPKLPDLITAFSKLMAGNNGNGKVNVIPRAAAPLNNNHPRPEVTAAPVSAVKAPGPVTEGTQGQSPPSAGNLEMVASDEQPQATAEEEEAMLKLFLLKYGKEIEEVSNQLREAVANERTDIYPNITEIISRFTDQADFNLKIGHVNAETILGYILMLDKKSYVENQMKQKLYNYIQKYIEFVRSQGDFYTQCNKCQDFASFDNRQQFNAEGKTCGQELQGGAKCDGTLVAIY